MAFIKSIADKALETKTCIIRGESGYLHNLLAIHNSSTNQENQLKKSKTSGSAGNKISGIQRRQFLAGTVVAATSVALSEQAGAQDSDDSLRLYSWPDYIDDVTLADFSAQSGISISVDAYDNSDEMLSTIASTDNQYDIVIAAYDYIEEMIARNFLLPIDHREIPNSDNLLPVFTDSVFDPGRRFTMPFLWGTQGICYRKSTVTKVPDSWRILFESEAHSGRIAIPGPDTLGLALKYLGYSYNSVNADELEAAGELIIQQKPHVRSLSYSDGIELLANGDVAVDVGWNSEIRELMKDDDDIDYRVPNEGSLVWQDCLCILRTTPNASKAHLLLNYALDAEVAATIAEKFWYATPNEAALKLLPAAYREDHVIFPGMEIIERCEAALNLGEAGTRLRDRIWKKVSEA